MPRTGQITCECATATACCAALEVEPLDNKASEGLANGFKALGDPHRMAIIHLLTAAGEPVCVVDIERHLPLSQSTVSYHLKTLLDSGVINRERRSKWNYYTVNPGRLGELTTALESYTSRLAAMT